MSTNLVTLTYPNTFNQLNNITSFVMNSNSDVLLLYVGSVGKTSATATIQWAPPSTPTDNNNNNSKKGGVLAQQLTLASLAIVAGTFILSSF